ncbi:unnamed protein product [Calypogeia fissa]
MDLNRRMVVLAICTTCAALAVIVVLKRRNKFLRLISKSPAKAPQAQAMAHDHTSLKRRAFEVQQQLEVSTVVGIVGIGGIGKTTIAKQLFNTLSPQFYYTCFLNNVDCVEWMEWRKSGDWVLNHFLRNGTKVKYNSLTWSDVKMSSTLIFMEDVDSEDQFSILPTVNKFGNGSRLIFTARDRGVLDSIPNCFIYEVEFLNFDEAKKLFCQHAFEEERIPDSLVKVHHHLEENVKQVVQRCDGLPLTLEVLGSYLRGHKTNARVWEEAVEKLGRAQSITGVRNDRVLASLLVSFDALSPEEQGMVIDASGYFFERPVQEALDAWSTVYGDSESRWANLLRTSMVKEVESDSKSADREPDKKYSRMQVWVHEHLRDLAKVVSGGKKMVSGSLDDGRDARDLFNTDKGKLQSPTGIRLLRLPRFPAVDKPPKVQSDLLAKFENLKYLELSDVEPQGSGKNLSTKLSLLNWRLSRKLRGPPTPFPISLEGMTNLAVLELEHWAMLEENFEALGKLSNLRTLSLSSIRGPARLTESFGSLSRLRWLELRYVGLTALPQSFGNLGALEHLALVGLDKLEELPESFGNLRSLARLEIVKCSKLASLPDSFGRLSSLAKLGNEACAALDCPQPTIEYRQQQVDSCGILSSLTSLHLEECRKLRRLPDNFGQLRALRTLSIVGAPQLQSLSDDFGDLASLQRLKLANCQQLQSLPDNFGDLASLQRLNLANCQQLQSLPDNFGPLSVLQELELVECGQLHRLRDSLGAISALKILKLDDAAHLEALADSCSGNHFSLEHLVLDAKLMPRFAESVVKFHALRKLTVLRTKLRVIPGTRLTMIPEELGSLSSLEILRLQGQHIFDTLPDSLGRISSLRVVILIGCRRVTSPPDSLGKCFLPHGDTPTETTRPAWGQSSQIACTDVFRLHVKNCPSFGHSKMRGLGWIRCDEPDSHPYGEDDSHYEILHGCDGIWYQRKLSGEDSTQVTQQLH